MTAVQIGHSICPLQSGFMRLCIPLTFDRERPCE